MRLTRVLLVIVAVVCFGVALSYPIRYFMAKQSNDSDMEQLAAMRSQVQRQEGEVSPLPVEEAGAADSAESASPGEPDAERGPRTITQPPAEAEATPEGAEAEAEPEEYPNEYPDEWADEWAEDDGEEEDVAPGVPIRPTRAPEDVTAAPFWVEATEAPQSAAEGDLKAPIEEAAPQARPEAEPRGEPQDEPSEGPEAASASPAGSDRAGEGAEDEPGRPEEAPETPEPTLTPEPTPTPLPPPESDFWNLEPEPRPTALPVALSRVKAAPTPEPTVTVDPALRVGPLPYTMKEKVEFDESAMLPELRDIYALNHDLVGWITIPDTVIDYPVVQTKDSEFYLTHDFYGEENVNGQIILDTLCDPYTPSYNLIISGHHMKNGSMFGDLPEYRTKSYWEKHRFLEFDTLMDRKSYVIFAAFYSADYDEHEEGFRYNANIVYKIDAKLWLEEVRENQLYDTGVDAEFGDEFITLTTCNRARHRNGRFVVVCRKIREGETFE